jgi:Holliday junction resolvase
MALSGVSGVNLVLTVEKKMMEELVVESRQKKSKTLNYSPEDVEKLLRLYAEHGTENIDTIAMQMSKTVRSVRSKLVSLKVYVPIDKTKTKKTKVPSKKELLAQLSSLTGSKHEGLDPASKACIFELITIFKNAKGYE